MLRRVNPIVLLSCVLGLILSLGIFAGAQMGGGTASDALGVAEGQVGKPFVMGTDGPDTFSCVGLMRYALRTAGVDPDAPWSPEAYLGRYPSVAPGDLQPGDIVIYPGWATMYSGGGMLVNANEMEGVVTHTPMDVAGTPLGIVRPGSGGGTQPVAEDPAAVDPMAIDPMAVDPMAVDPAFVDPAFVDPGFVDPAAVEPMVDPAFVDPAFVDSAAVDPMAADPGLVDPAALDPAAQF